MSDQPAPPLSESKKQQRQIRVFISSTFRDMHEERNYLVTHIFPQLRKLCDQRGVVWGEVDLRWGINDEQKAEGKVLPICLEEIKRCRPYFIGLLGERYGWVPDAIPQELVDRESWLKEHLGKAGKSVTELEILHGVLNDPEMTEHAFFYFRDPAYIESIPPEKQKDFTAEDAEGAEKLRRLKERIRKGKFPPQENYPNPKALGELVLKDLTAVIERLYPKGSEPSPLDRDAMEHDVFAQSRAKVYIRRKEYFDRLDEHVHGDGPPLVILGESGSGKSALLANWALQYRQKHPEELLIMHFIGSTPYSADWMAMLRRIMGEFYRRFDIQGEIPDKPDALRQAFANWLYMAAAKGKVVLILDALNQLEDRDGAPDLVWLPQVMPPKIRLILSTLPVEKRKDFTAESAEGAEKLIKLKEQIRSRPLEELKRRDWPTLTVEPLNQSERKVFIKDYLKQYVKELDTIQTERIAAAQQTSNPLYLRAILEELRLFGKYEELDKKITYYLEAQNPCELYKKIVVRWEEDYEEDNDLVGESMSLIWASRCGLSEGELLDILGKDGEPLPQAVWSPLFLAAEGSLVNRSGLLNFFHDYLRDAIRDTYLPTKDLQKETHMRLADYFEKQDLSTRKIDELPWLLCQAGAWQQLRDALADVKFFNTAWKISRFEVESYWTQLEDHSFSIAEAYKDVITPAREAPDCELLLHIFTLLGDRGHFKEVLTFIESLSSMDGNVGFVAACLSKQAESLFRLGDMAAATQLQRQSESMLRVSAKTDTVPDLAFLFAEPTYLYAAGDINGALFLLKRQETMLRRFEYKDVLGKCLMNQANILFDLGNIAKALVAYKEAEQLSRENNDIESLAMSLDSQANVLREYGELDQAMRLEKEAERICRKIGNLIVLQGCIGNQALTVEKMGDLDMAMQLHKEEERICWQLGHQEGISRSFGNQARILKQWGRLDEAMALHKEEERICRQLGNKDGLQRSLCNQATIICDERGDVEDAIPLLAEAERICRELGYRRKLVNILAARVRILKGKHDRDGMMRLFVEMEELCRDLNEMGLLQYCLGEQALILNERGDLDGAVSKFKEQARIRREVGK